MNSELEAKAQAVCDHYKKLGDKDGFSSTVAILRAALGRQPAANSVRAEHIVLAARACLCPDEYEAFGKIGYDARLRMARNISRQIAAPQPVAAGGDVKTDLSKHLRKMADGHYDGSVGYSKLMNDAADEIERYYISMLNWKATAEAMVAAPAGDAVAVAKSLDVRYAEGHSAGWKEGRAVLSDHVKACICEAIPGFTAESNTLRELLWLMQGKIKAARPAPAAQAATRILTHQNICVVGRTQDGADIDLPIFGDGAKDGKYLVLVALPAAQAAPYDPTVWQLRRVVPRMDIGEHDNILQKAAECGFAYDGQGAFECNSDEIIAFAKALAITQSPAVQDGPDFTVEDDDLNALLNAAADWGRGTPQNMDTGLHLHDLIETVSKRLAAQPDHAAVRDGVIEEVAQHIESIPVKPGQLGYVVYPNIVKTIRALKVTQC